MSPKHLPIPDPNRPHPLTPPPVPIQLSSLATPLPEARESQEQQQRPATVEGKSSVVVPCGTACEESDLSIHTIPPSEGGTLSSLLSGTNPSNSSSDANTGDSAVTSSNTGETTTSKGTQIICIYVHVCICNYLCVQWMSNFTCICYYVIQICP